MPTTSKRVHSSDDESEEEVSGEEEQPSKRKRSARVIGREFILDDVEVVSECEEEEAADDEDGLNRMSPSERAEMEKVMRRAAIRTCTHFSNIFPCASAWLLLKRLA